MNSSASLVECLWSTEQHCTIPIQYLQLIIYVRHTSRATKRRATIFMYICVSRLFGARHGADGRGCPPAGNRTRDLPFPQPPLITSPAFNYWELLCSQRSYVLLWQCDCADVYLIVLRFGLPVRLFISLDSQSRIRLWI